MDNAPEAKMDVASVSEAEGCLLESSPTRHLVLVSHPLVRETEMLLTLNIKDWDEHHCFFYPLKSIDNYHLMVHLMFKLSADPSRILRTSAEMDIEQKDFNLLNLRKWRFA